MSATMITILLVTLKLFGVITWSWIFVLSPILAVGLFTLIKILLMFLGVIAVAKQDNDDDF